MTFADIASGNSGAADILFLIAVILAVISALTTWRDDLVRYAGPLLSGAVAAAAAGLLLL